MSELSQHLMLSHFFRFEIYKLVLHDAWPVLPFIFKQRNEESPEMNLELIGLLFKSESLYTHLTDN